RQREYPQPPPPSRSTTRRTIRRVSMSVDLLLHSRVEFEQRLVHLGLTLFHGRIRTARCMDRQATWPCATCNRAPCWHVSSVRSRDAWTTPRVGAIGNQLSP